MVSITKETLRGYILEEVLAYLIRTTGYKLLVDPRQDPQDLDTERGALVVKGRGAVHQVDVLGQLKWIPAFTFPLRLFIEAKFRGKPIGLPIIRNAVGTILDINQNNSLTRDNPQILQKYQYAYALFSTSGFTQPAVDMALSHQISLIDLSIPDFNGLLDTIDRIAGEIISRFYSREGGLSEDLSDQESTPSRTGLVSSIRSILRHQLHTQPVEIEIDINRDLTSSEKTFIDNSLSPVVEKAEEFDELFVAMANGPYMILLKADSPQDFITYAIEHPQHDVTIHWNSEIDQGRTWVIQPAVEANNIPYKLTFRLPTAFAKYIFGKTNKMGEIRERAIDTKQTFFSNITIYRYSDGDQLIRLKFNLTATQEFVEG